jgi:nitroreductase
MAPTRYGTRGDMYAVQDATILAAYIQLVAVNYGLSTCWVGAFREYRIIKELVLEDNLKPIAVLPIGYSPTIKERGRRKGIDKIYTTLV